MIKKYIQERYLKQANSQNHRAVLMANFDDIHTIGLLSNPKNEAEIKVLENVVNHFQGYGKQIFPLIYFDKQIQKDVFTKNSGLNGFSKKQCNWIGKPKKENNLDRFLQNDFDILIDFSFSPAFSLQYIFVLAKAKLKIMPTNDFSKQYADLMLEASDPQDKLTFAKELTHYLEIINKTPQ